MSPNYKTAIEEYEKDHKEDLKKEHPDMNDEELMKRMPETTPEEKAKQEGFIQFSAVLQSLFAEIGSIIFDFNEKEDIESNNGIITMISAVFVYMTKYTNEELKITEEVRKGLFKYADACNEYLNQVVELQIKIDDDTDEKEKESEEEKKEELLRIEHTFDTEEAKEKVLKTFHDNAKLQEEQDQEIASVVQKLLKELEKEEEKGEKKKQKKSTTSEKKEKAAESPKKKGEGC